MRRFDIWLFLPILTVAISAAAVACSIVAIVLHFSH